MERVRSRRERRAREERYEQDLKMLKKIEDQAKDVLGIYEKKGPIWGMGAAGAALLLSAIGLIGALRPAYSDGYFVLILFLVLAGAAFVITASLLFNRERARTARVRGAIVTKALEDKQLLTTLVTHFVLSKLPPQEPPAA